MRHRCPVCGGRFRRFERAGLNGRPNAACPRCGAYERHRALWLWLRDFTDFFAAPLDVLHWAPEPGFEARLRALPNLRYESADLEPGVGMATLDITAIDRPDASYDRVLCLHVLEHVGAERAALRELARVLRPGGWAVLQVPITRAGETIEDPDEADPAERLRRFGQADHVRAYGPDVAQRIEAAGLTVQRIDPLAGRSEASIERHRLRPSEPLVHGDALAFWKVAG